MCNEIIKMAIIIGLGGWWFNQRSIDGRTGVALRALKTCLLCGRLYVVSPGVKSH